MFMNTDYYTVYHGISHLDMVVPVVVEVENPVELAVTGHTDLIRVLHAFTQGLPRVLLHLDVVELPAILLLLSIYLSICI